MFGTANAIASSADKTFSYIPDCSDLPVDENADYVYICLNNTIYGTVYHELPNTKGKTLGVFGEETVNVLGVNLDIALAMGLVGEISK